VRKLPVRPDAMTEAEDTVYNKMLDALSDRFTLTPEQELDMVLGPHDEVR
jgi:hypothetical protein